MSATRPVLRRQFLALCDASHSQLALAFDNATPVVPALIADYRYNGISLGLPAWIEKLSWKKFAKEFVQRADGSIHGWNLRIEQSALGSPWRPQTKRGADWQFGPFGLREIANSPHVEIDYSLGTRGLSPMRRLRDPLRSLDDRCDILLGRSLVDIGYGRRLGTPSWFVLQRGCAL